MVPRNEGGNRKGYQFQREWYQSNGSGFFEVGENLAGVLIGRKNWIEDLLDSTLANDETEPFDAYWWD